jgi:hypothetical protein
MHGQSSQLNTHHGVGHPPHLAVSCDGHIMVCASISPSPTFCSCFASPHRRAAQTAELLWTPWSGQVGPVTYLDSLREADLGWFQGRRNGEEGMCVCVGGGGGQEAQQACLCL